MGLCRLAFALLLSVSFLAPVRGGGKGRLSSRRRYLRTVRGIMTFAEMLNYLILADLSYFFFVAFIRPYSNSSRRR